MKKLVALAVLVATVAFAGTAFADGGSLQDRELQKLFAWSAQATDQVTLTAGPGAGPTAPVSPALEYRGSDIR